MIINCIFSAQCILASSIVLYHISLSAIKAYNRYHPCHKVLWINTAANITFSVITPQTAGFEPSTGGKSSYHSAVILAKNLGQYQT